MDRFGLAATTAVMIGSGGAGVPTPMPGSADGWGTPGQPRHVRLTIARRF
ncbi:MAG: hypothetical protein V4564_01230 [Pseudomonadota bacterium]|nr:hypothetical protein [Sphingomonas sp. ERG5]